MLSIAEECIITHWALWLLFCMGRNYEDLYISTVSEAFQFVKGVNMICLSIALKNEYCELNASIKEKSHKYCVYHIGIIYMCSAFLPCTANGLKLIIKRITSCNVQLLGSLSAVCLFSERYCIYSKYLLLMPLCCFLSLLLYVHVHVWLNVRIHLNTQLGYQCAYLMFTVLKSFCLRLSFSFYSGSEYKR